MSDVTSDGIKAWRSSVVGNRVVVEGIATPPAIAPLMEDRLAVSPDGRVAVVAKTGADRAYRSVNFGPWIELGRAFGSPAQCVAWTGHQFEFAWVGPGGSPLNVLREDGTSTIRPIPGGTSGGILQYDEIDRAFVLTDIRRHVVVGPYTLAKAVRRRAADGSVWWGGQDTREFDKLQIVHQSGYGWLAGRQPEVPQLALTETELHVNEGRDGPFAFYPKPAPVAPMGELWDGYFYEASARYGSRLAVGNCTVIVEKGLLRATSKRVILAPRSDAGEDLIAEWAQEWDRVVALYCTAEAENTPAALEQVIKTARARVARLGLARRQCLAYAGRSYWPDITAEVWGVECYQDAGEALAAARGRWAKQLMAVVAAKQAAIISGDYDRAGRLTEAQLLEAQTTYTDFARGRWGRLRFSHGRPGGTRQHKALLPSHDAGWRATSRPAIIVPPAPKPPDPPDPPDPNPPEPPMPTPYFPTDAEFTKFFLDLNAKYHTDPDMQKPHPRPLLAKSQDPVNFPDVYVDPIGLGRWTMEFGVNCQVHGMNAQQSTAAVFASIDRIVGNP